ncbi:amino acid ABC transporter permease [Castellaniella sp.]|uniref:amino acid ABC transporter permease n=1 Tax=Castellaniella sp. TaxID=1955812 RepID=UPI003C730C1C
MNFDLIIGSLPAFGRGVLYTIGISLSSIALGALLGFSIHAAYRRFPKQLGILYETYIWVIRGTPFLAQLFIAYYGLPAIGVTPSAMQAAVATLAIYGSAYFAEIFRASWNSIPKGHAEAAIACGIPPLAVFLKIEMPQAVRYAIPLLVNQSIVLIKESSLASIITVPELTLTAGKIVAETYSFVEPYLLLALTYWALTYLTSILGRQIEKSFSR